jgi:hypothetical protein
MLSSENLAEVEKAQPALVCIGFLAQGPSFPVRQLCKRLRSRFPNLPILVGRWGARDRDNMEPQLTGLVQAIGWDLAETKNQVMQFAQVNPADGAFEEERLALAQRDGHSQ